MSGQRYADPRSLEWMAAGLCPECGEPPSMHPADGFFWQHPRFTTFCSLLRRGVEDRIEQYRQDKEARDGAADG